MELGGVVVVADGEAAAAADGEEEATADTLAPTGDAERDKRARKRLEEEIARMKKNQERRLHRKNAKIVKEGGTPLQLNRPIKPDTTVSPVRRYPRISWHSRPLARVL